jgi:predicted hydrolase (HD superfamily)
MHDRNTALALLHEYTQSESLRKHALSVEAAMRWYAEHFNCTPEEIEKWGICGLLHDFDYEQFPEPVAPNGHPYKGNAILQELGYSDDIREAIMGHAEYSGVPRLTLMAKTLFAVDELCGLTTATALVRPDKSLLQVEPNSVRKKFKDKAFAKGCSRDDIRKGAEEIGIELEVHMANVLTAMQKTATELGLPQHSI